MFYSIRGKLIYLEENTAVIECSGVGYNCNITLTTKNDLKDFLNQEVMLYTHLNVREDAITLFGFSKKFELDCFKLLTTVSGVGAKVGITILSSLKPENIINAISSGNSKILTCAPGVGNKLAQRIILELKDKLGKINGFYNENLAGNVSSHTLNSNVTKATDALVSLGYSLADVQKVLINLDPSLSVEELIKESLKLLSRRI